MRDVEVRNGAEGAGHAPALDGLRGAAALLVFLSHASLAGVPLVPGVDFAGMGKPGVYLFFVLSAFLLTRNAIMAGAEAFRPRALGRYFVRRALRIYPAFAAYLLFALAATAAAGLLTDKPRVSPFLLDLEGFAAHLLLFRGEGVTWSIAVEFKYYVALPPIAWALWRAGRAGPAPLALVSAALVAAAIGAERLAPPEVNDMRLWPYLVLFVSGSVLAAWTLASPPGRRLAGWLGALGFAAAALTSPTLLSWATGAETPPDALHGAHVLFALVWCAALTGCVFGPEALSRPLRAPAARALGRISFSFYLWHVVAIGLAKAASPALGPLAGLAALLGALALAFWSHRLVERPAYRAAALSPRPSRDGADARVRRDAPALRFDA